MALHWVTREIWKEIQDAFSDAVERACNSEPGRYWVSINTTLLTTYEHLWEDIDAQLIIVDNRQEGGDLLACLSFWTKTNPHDVCRLFKELKSVIRITHLTELE